MIGRRAHVETDREHLLQSGHDQRGLHRVTVPSPLLLSTFYIRAASLGRYLKKITIQDIKQNTEKQIFFLMKMGQISKTRGKRHKISDLYRVMAPKKNKQKKTAFNKANSKQNTIPELKLLNTGAVSADLQSNTSCLTPQSHNATADLRLLIYDFRNIFHH